MNSFVGLIASLYDLFADMSIVVLFMILIGLMFLIIELFQPSKGLFAIGGAILVITGIVFRMLGGGTVTMLFLMVFFVCVTLMSAHVIMLYTQKKLWLYQSLNLAINCQSSESEEYKYLIGQIGVATSDIKINGTISINDVNFHVQCDSFIGKGELVRVVKVDTKNIFIEKT